MTDILSRYEDLKRRMFDLANQQTELMMGMSPEARLKYIKEVITDSVMVFGIWQDESEDNDVGMFAIKGEREFLACIASGQTITGRISAVPCIDKAQAIAAQRMLGDGAVNGH